jgi:hypothetical protein
LDGRRNYPTARRLLTCADAGGSKWNKIEHRLFSFISLNWKGNPVVNYGANVNFIGATETAAC